MNAFTLLGILFVALKLLGLISWSWIWVTAPFWSGLVIWCVLVICVGYVEYLKRSHR